MYLIYVGYSLMVVERFYENVLFFFSLQCSLF